MNGDNKETGSSGNAIGTVVVIILIALGIVFYFAYVKKGIPGIDTNTPTTEKTTEVFDNTPTRR